MLFVGRKGKTSENDMAIRTIGGVTYQVDLWLNEAAQQYMPVLITEKYLIDEMGEPSSQDTYLVDENNIPYKWSVTKWVPLFPNSNVQGPPGDSAYQLAAAAGFVGTQSEWLESLIGPVGANGQNATLSIGTVTTLQSGDQATAEISGEYPNQTLDLGIPMGESNGNVYKQGVGLVTAKSWFGSAVTSELGEWSVDYTEAGFTEAPIVYAQSVAGSAPAAGTTLANPVSTSSTTCSGIAGVGLDIVGAGVTINIYAIGV